MSELPKGWATSSLSQLVLKLVDGSHSPPPKQPEGLPMLSARNISDGRILFDEFRLIKQEDFEREDKRTSARPSDVLLTIVGAIGRSAIIPICTQRFTLQRSVAVVRPLDGIDPQYLKYAFDAPEFQRWMVDNAKGTAQKGIYLNKLAGAFIPVAPADEQRRIVAKLDNLFARSRRAREELERIPKLCDRYKQAVLAAACSGRLTSDWREQNPNVEPASELLQRVQKERENRYQEEALKLKNQGKNIPKLPEFKYVNSSIDIPENWVSLFVESACLFIVDCLHSTPQFIAEGEYCVDTTSIEPRKIIWSKVRKVSQEEFVERSSRMLPSKGDVIFSREGTIGTVVRIENDPKFCLGQRMMMFRFSPLVSSEYAELYLQSPSFVEQYKPLIMGTSSPHLNIGAIRKMIFLVPSFAEQKEITKRVEKLFKIIDLMKQEYQKASKLCDRLEQVTLSKAFRGELVPQDLNDETAAALLERLQAENPTQTKGKSVKSKQRSGGQS